MLPTKNGQSDQALVDSSKELGKTSLVLREFVVTDHGYELT